MFDGEDIDGDGVALTVGLTSFLAELSRVRLDPRALLAAAFDGDFVEELEALMSFEDLLEVETGRELGR